MSIEVAIAGFSAAIRDPSAPLPPSVLGRLGTPDARRFAVYRNNIAVGLIGAIEARYPSVCKVLGAEAFRGLARAFVYAEMPRSPVLIAYGDSFPDFIEARCADLGQVSLADLARLENAWVEAYHSEDAPNATIEDLANLDVEVLHGARITLHPAARLLRLATPAASVWASCQEGGKPFRGSTPGEDVLVTRPESDVFVRVLPASGYTFMKRLQEGATLAETADCLPDPDEFGSHLVGLIVAGAVKSIIVGEGR